MALSASLMACTISFSKPCSSNAFFTSSGEKHLLVCSMAMVDAISPALVPPTPSATTKSAPFSFKGSKSLVEVSVQSGCSRLAQAMKASSFSSLTFPRSHMEAILIFLFNFFSPDTHPYSIDATMGYRITGYYLSFDLCFDLYFDLLFFPYYSHYSQFSVFLF